ncbi:MAG: efflux RND transporter periplasmic adaptor subunit [Acidobacteriia bacterium]|nr:efflux RND transporter periplasmic adaptor subunit [Terriglobia bacterium]
MKILSLLTFALALPALTARPICTYSGDEPAISSSTVSVHTVQRGTMPFHTLGRGMMARIGPNARARVQILLPFARNLKIGHPASIKIVGVCGALTGKVAMIGELGTEEQVPIELVFDQPLPTGVRVGDSSDAVIEYGRIENTLFMERGGFGQANTDAVVFRVDPDRKQATRVNVRFGAIASEMIEIKSGLHEGDKVIVSDMSRWVNYDRIRLD